MIILYLGVSCAILSTFMKQRTYSIFTSRIGGGRRGEGTSPLAGNAVSHYYPTQTMKKTTLTVTGRGQVTFRKDVLQHLGIQKGGKIELDKLPDGRVTLRAAQSAGKIEDFLGLLAGRTSKVATLEEIGAAAAAGWAGQK